MVLNRREIGKLGEDIVCKYLLNKKYKILNRNYHSRYGEVDIITKDLEGFLVFIEVKARTSSKYGQGYEAVDSLKQEKIVKTAYVYLEENKIKDDNYRIDVLSIELDFRHRIGRVTHFYNAVGEDV
ncbi:MAG: YraN family protein [Parcubacteria group bacterium]|nr:YraN family protein [Parcubacteria group bacterium]